ncbi:NAD(P)(+) transhydrogenase (Re/Si-specific) subunit beta [Coraliomargarita sp. SDUM461004]|uniref:NAD(P) transhydrogenase subunit beta n=1 Tax=Thalassobacterium sedimentorum TaxID=3041258 RepID=A0ABU1AJU2_9BACT|nr:NAD(P)(+) transhydrogenase (Re/Si-specific) subunit beta [Coraliomargarita sp. SDUM461004]MDQ8195043.1 NAD(P)(+) transhydrogenase (Re/Si-specific) subunit beta [Coraliomargarita sp. SDUM461004]
MHAETILNLSYIVAAILFILGIKMLGKADTAKRGNQLSSLGMLVAIVVTLLSKGLDYPLVLSALAIGTVIGIYAAKRVKMTGMPELVALFNGFGGLASLLVGWAEYHRVATLSGEIHTPAPIVHFSSFSATVTVLAIFIGGITFTGSIYAWGKLSGQFGGRALTFSGQKTCNGFVALAILVSSVIFSSAPSGEMAYPMLIIIILLSLLLGVFAVMPIGGGDMPVVISLLNSCSGLAACAAGFVINNNVLVVAGCLVGASGLILTVIMCKAMNRTLKNVLFSGFGATKQAASTESSGELKPISAEDAYYILEAAKNVIIIPGYGMAVAQAQHAVKELGELLEANDCEVRFAIHPVAGRMPGHMNVLLAEADVPYEQLVEMDDVNPTIEMVDVAIVIGANDVVNPAAANDESSPIYGMPIIEAHKAKTTFCLKRGKGAGFSGLENQLFTAPNTRMIYGDAKATVTSMVAQFKES